MADREHHAIGIAPPPRLAPRVELAGQIGRGLPGERRIGRADAFTIVAMASGAGGNAARRIAVTVQPPAAGPRAPLRFGKGHFGIMEGDRPAFGRAEAPGDPRHLRMVAPPVGIGLELALEIAGVEPRQPRRAGPVAAAIEAVTGEAGVGGSRAGAAKRDHFAGRGETLIGRRVDGGAGRQRQGRGGRSHSRPESSRHASFATSGTEQRFRRAMPALLPLLLLAGACKPPPDQGRFMPLASADRGKAAIDHVGCASCHAIPGIDWPRGRTGPALQDFAERGLIAGRLPNRPEILAAYVRNAPALVPGSAMPAMPVSEREARDIAAYLYQLEGR